MTFKINCEYCNGIIDLLTDKVCSLCGATIKLNSKLNQEIKKQDEEHHVEDIVFDNKHNSFNKYIYPKKDCISTGSTVIDSMLGIGGIPVGYVTEIYGPESSGKSTICLQIAHHTQELFQDKLVMYVDTERSFDSKYAMKLGINMDKLMVVYPEDYQDCFEIIQTSMKTGKFSLIILDSVSTLIQRRPIEFGGRDIDFVKKGILNITSHFADSQTTIIFTNQIRQRMENLDKINPQESVCAYPASVRIELCRQKPEWNIEGSFFYQSVKINIVKNRFAKLSRNGHTLISFGKGVDKFYELIENIELYGRHDGTRFSISIPAEDINISEIGQRDFKKSLMKLEKTKVNKLCSLLKIKLMERDYRSLNAELDN